MTALDTSPEVIQTAYLKPEGEGRGAFPVFVLTGVHEVGDEVYLDDLDVTVIVQALDPDDGLAVAVREDDVEGVA